MRKYPRTESRWGFIAFLFCLMVLALAIACGGGGDSGEEAAEPDMEEAAEADAMEEDAEAETMDEDAEGETMEEDAEGESDTEEMSSDAPRIFFIEPADDGATVTSPVTFTFGYENFIIEARGEGEVHEGAGHHHLGLNTECLPAGVAIPEADPWVHFGDGSATMEMQLAAGEQTLTIQIGDGAHVTLDEPGLCQTITITVAEE